MHLSASSQSPSPYDTQARQLCQVAAAVIVKLSSTGLQHCQLHQRRQPAKLPRRHLQVAGFKEHRQREAECPVSLPAGLMGWRRQACSGSPNQHAATGSKAPALSPTWLFFTCRLVSWVNSGATGRQGCRCPAARSTGPCRRVCKQAIRTPVIECITWDRMQLISRAGKGGSCGGSCGTHKQRRAVKPDRKARPWAVRLRCPPRSRRVN